MSFFSTPPSNAVGPPIMMPEKDIEVADPPGDSISSLAFSPQADYLAVGSWDNNVRIYDVGLRVPPQGKAMYGHEGPVMSVCWNKEGSKVFSGGADNAGRMFDVTTGQTQQVAQHDAPIRVVKWIESPQGNVLVSGSWDKTLKYWDLRTPNAVATVQLPERCYALDVQYPLMVVGTAERHIQVFSLTNPTTAFKSIQSPLKRQTRAISCFHTGGRYAIGSIEGRIAIQYIDEKDNDKNYSFKCHRQDQSQNVNVKDQSIVYTPYMAPSPPVVRPHPFPLSHRPPILIAYPSHAGSDGLIHFWDIDARTRLKSFAPAQSPVPATAFNRSGTIFAYAVSYDWSKGHASMVPGSPNKLMLHVCKDDEVKRKPMKR
ncbi:Poly(A)+ RNA export protein [Grifola frondosa]|uniref:Poly(A)+ RNA export protein n=1 Tax=Grifola frondosa TaxID=5627 RepID=A0A1C7M678_GRIFR|nr:Poly(A)+ RNA export protein [Grifola frondosa]